MSGSSSKVRLFESQNGNCSCTTWEEAQFQADHNPFGVCKTNDTFQKVIIGKPGFAEDLSVARTFTRDLQRRVSQLYSLNVHRVLSRNMCGGALQHVVACTSPNSLNTSSPSTLEGATTLLYTLRMPMDIIRSAHDSPLQPATTSCTHQRLTTP